MKKAENMFMDETLQKALLKLISEEYFAYQFYTLGELAVEPEERGALSGLFRKIAEDELADHLRELVEWCRQYKYEIPCSEKDFKKHAGKKISKMALELKSGENAGYYLDLAEQQEILALESYKEALKLPVVFQFTDLQSLLWHIYYDEEEHLGEIRTAKIAYEAGCDLTMG